MESQPNEAILIASGFNRDVFDSFEHGIPNGIIQLISKYFEYYPTRNCKVISCGSQENHNDRNHAVNVLRDIDGSHWWTSLWGHRRHQFIKFDFGFPVRLRAIQIWAANKTACPDRFRIQCGNTLNTTEKERIIQNDGTLTTSLTEDEVQKGEKDKDVSKWDIIADNIKYNWKSSPEIQNDTQNATKKYGKIRVKHVLDDYDFHCSTYRIDKDDTDGSIKKYNKYRYWLLYLYKNCGADYTAINRIRFVVYAGHYQSQNDKNDTQTTNAN